MSKAIATINAVFALILAPVALALGGWDILLQILVSFVIIDYLTGLINAICEHSLSSEVGFKGIFKKVVIFALVYVAVQLDKATGTPIFRTMTILFYVSNEGISILENAGRLGVPYPQKLKDILIQLEKKTEEPQEEGKANGQ